MRTALNRRAQIRKTLGQGIAEYGLIIFLVSIAAIGFLESTNGTVSRILSACVEGLTRHG